MKKHITEIFPWLLPLRKRQKRVCFYISQKFDGNRYAGKQEKYLLPYEIFSSDSELINYETGFDLRYQENKVHNLKLVARNINGLVICPGETFSFWNRARDADAVEPYMQGLVVENGELKALYGGGLCQMSNLLFWIFLHSPLTIVERHGHRIRSFPETKGTSVKGSDATVSEGWLDLKVRNDTNNRYQIVIEFSDKWMKGTLLSDDELDEKYEIINGNVKYVSEHGRIFEEAEVIRRINKTDGENTVLYVNRCEIGYLLTDDIKVETGN